MFWAHLALEALWVKVPVHGPEPGRRPLAFLGHDRVLAEGAAGGALPVDGKKNQIFMSRQRTLKFVDLEMFNFFF